MGKKGDYVPRGDAEYNGWYKHITQYVSVKTGGTAPEWAHIVDARLAELLKAYENWYAAYAPCLKLHTDAETKTKNERKAAVTRIMRAFVQQFLMFPPVTDADRINMKLPVRDKTHTLIPRPDKPPVFILRPKSNRSIQIDFRAEEGGGRAKPYGYAGVVVNYALLDHPPADYRELTEHKFVTSTPYTIEFTESDRGRRLYVALFWQNTKGDEGFYGPRMRPDLTAVVKRVFGCL